jgi:hypothetical protein
MLEMFKPRARRVSDGSEEVMPDSRNVPQQLPIDVAYLVTGICFILGLRY